MGAHLFSRSTSAMTSSCGCACSVCVAPPQVAACIALQVVVGRLKHIGLTARLVDARNRGKRFRWHGKVSVAKGERGNGGLARSPPPHETL